MQIIFSAVLGKNKCNSNANDSGKNHDGNKRNKQIRKLKITLHKTQSTVKEHFIYPNYGNNDMLIMVTMMVRR